MAFFQKLYNFHVVSCCNLQNWQKYRGGSCSNLFHVALPAKLKAFFFLQKWFILFPEYPYRGLSPSPWSVSFPVVCVPTDHQPPTTDHQPPTTKIIFPIRSTSGSELHHIILEQKFQLAYLRPNF